VVARGSDGARGSAYGGTSSYDGTHGALTRGGDSKLKGSNGHNQGDQSDAGGS
jgi:hypothetical protein